MTDLGDNIKACRTCGIHFVAPSKHQLKHLFQSGQEHSEIILIRRELSQWNVEISENDGFPQYVCNTCIHKFEKVFQLRTACINAQNEFRKFYAVANQSVTDIKIKSEVPDNEEETGLCDFIYVDELSDGEYDGATPFNIPHIPIKEELIEAASVPIEDSGQPVKELESASTEALPANAVYSLATDFVTQNDTVTFKQEDVISTLSCNLCHQTFSKHEDFKHHLQTIHDLRDLECHICGKEFKNSTTARLRFHIKWHSLKRQVKCNLCGYICHSIDILNAHKRTNHRKLHCKICGKAILAKNMKSHLRQHELQENYPCEYCAEAFDNENEREGHIWQVHAAEDNPAANSVINYEACYTHPLSSNVLNMAQEESISQEQPHKDFLYKYLCAHCDHRFMQQLDLEIHVKENHRVNHFKAKTALAVDASQIPVASETVENGQNSNEHALYERYNDNSILVMNSNESQINPSNFIQAQNEIMQGAEITTNSSCDEHYDNIEIENDTNKLLPFSGTDLNTFACAKCSETFAAIEQLREHHEQHLAAVENKPNTSPTKSKFHCHICGKLFDLKFRLNRHIKKHKNHAPL